MMIANSRGFRIRYQEWGRGPALVLLHGFPMWGDRWRDTGYVGALEDRFRVIVPDLLGHGQSDKPHESAAYGMPNMAADVIAVLDAAGAGRAHVWGYSMGSNVAQNMAVIAADRVMSLVLGGYPPGLDQEQERARRGTEVPQTWEEMLDGFPPVVIDMFRAHNDDFAAVQACWAALSDTRATVADLQSVVLPTLVYIGADDEGAELTRQQCDALGYRLEMVPGGHVLAFRQAASILPLAISHLDESTAALS
jgi:pimeloyl-ACP methyl ester carboxylesterase